MRKDTLFFAGTTAFATVVAFMFWGELREGNARIAELQQQGHGLNSSPDVNPAYPADNVAIPPPSVGAPAVPAPPVGQAMPGDASPPALSPSGCDEATVARARQSAAITIAQWAVELQLAPDEVQRITQARQAESVARLPCAYTAGSGVDVQQLQEQFLWALGPARLEQLLDLNAERGTKGAMSFYVGQFKDKDAPLNDEQSQQLATILLAENRRARHDAVREVWSADPRMQLAYIERQLKLAEERAGRIQTAAQSFLSEGQLTQLRDIAKVEMDQRRSTVRAWRETVERGEGIRYQPPQLSIERQR